MTVVATQRLLQLLVLAQTWNACSGKPSPEALPKQHIVHRIQIWVVWWSQCHVRLMNDIFTLTASGGVRRRAVLLQRPLVVAAPLHGCSNLLPTTFSSLILTVDLGFWFHKHNACLSCARDADRHRDVRLLMLHYQVASNSPGGATSNSKMSELGYYRHVYYTAFDVRKNCIRYNYLL